MPKLAVVLAAVLKADPYLKTNSAFEFPSPSRVRLTIEYYMSILNAIPILVFLYQQQTISFYGSTTTSLENS